MFDRLKSRECLADCFVSTVSQTYAEALSHLHKTTWHLATAQVVSSL